jgi:replicative superfamily II helicase
MVDFKKRMRSRGGDKKIHPVEIYDTLDRSSDTGPLRPIQIEILNKWFASFRENKDVILKLHTGQGKTLVGLLAQQSYINQGRGPCLYVCPNIYLVHQTAEQAKKFGVPTVQFKQNDSELPHEFLEGKKILICHAQKLFNGFSKFGLGRNSVKCGHIILDDSHACIDTIKETFTIKAEKADPVYEALFKLFQEELKEQGAGTFMEVQDGLYDAYLPISYWAWQDKIDQVLSIISEHRQEDSVKFTWPLLKDILHRCQCIISGSHLEITPYLNPIDLFGTFFGASQRLLMSATTMNDSFFIKGLGMSKDSVVTPLTIETEKWSGEKMILIPSIINEDLTKITIINHFAAPAPQRTKGVVVLTPSYKHCKPYGQQGCTIAMKETIYDEISKLKDGQRDRPLVIANRYDGIDLPDESCRILILDSKPYAESLLDRYEEDCREESEIINVKIAQKIEQGLGRSVRGEKDYSVILVIGADLVNFIKSPLTRKYFSAQTRSQINIGLELAQMTIEDHDFKTSKAVDIIKQLVKQCLVDRDDWRDFYDEKMSLSKEMAHIINITDQLTVEFRAEKAFSDGDSETAIHLIQSMLDSMSYSTSEVAWYLQMMARFKYFIQKTESNKLQTIAYRKNNDLLKPKEGFSYEKLNFIHINRTVKVRNWLSQFPEYNDMITQINNICSLLSFEETAEHFEQGLLQLGEALGFESQRPEKEMKEGPDNLWCLAQNEYIVFECKNEVEEKRDEISKTETGQINTSCGWFQNKYPGAELKPIMVIHAKNVSKAGAFNFPVEIMRKGKLKALKQNVKNLFFEFKPYDLKNISDEKIQEFINAHNLDIDSIKTLYSEAPYQR